MSPDILPSTGQYPGFLTWPFPRAARIRVINGKKKTFLDCEAAVSEIEKFQSVMERPFLERPMVIITESPAQPCHVNCQYRMTVEFILVNEKGVVDKIYTLQPHPRGGGFIQVFTGYRLILIAAPGTADKYHLTEQVTRLAQID